MFGTVRNALISFFDRLGAGWRTDAARENGRERSPAGRSERGIECGQIRPSHSTIGKRAGKPGKNGNELLNGVDRQGDRHSSIKHWAFLLQAYQQQQEQLKAVLDQLADNEKLIGSLQVQLSSLTGRNQEERQSLDAQLQQMELSLMTRNEECEGLVNEIRSVC